MKAPSVAYEKLKQRLVAAAPRSGYHCAVQIGDLSYAELAAVLQQDPSLLNDVACSESLLNSICLDLNTRRNAETFIGIALIAALTVDVRQHLLEELRSEQGIREELRVYS